MKSYLWPIGVLMLVVGLALIPAPGSAAPTYCNRIAAVMAGADGNSAVQYVELRKDSTGQNQVGTNGTELKFFDAAGNLTGTFAFPSDPPNIGQGYSILAATSAFASASNVAPDFVIPANVMAPAGKVQFTGPTGCASAGPVIDSVAYGNYTGLVDCGTPAAAATGLPTAGAQALVLNNLNTSCSNNATEYSLQQTPVPIPQSPPGPTSPRNNVTSTGFITLNVTCRQQSFDTESNTSVGSPCYLTPTGGFSGTVSLSCSGQPVGVTCTFAPNPVGVSPFSLDSTDLTVSVAGSVPVGAYAFQIVATSGSVVRTATIQLTVIAPAPGDGDGDGVPDSSDNCPNWPNPAQNLPPWPVPSGDPDCDGFTTTVENFVGTLPLSHCPATYTANDENPDAWPPDFNDDQTVNLNDLILLKPHFGAAPPSPWYLPRYDLNADNLINLTDVLRLKVYFGETCT